MSVDKMWGRCTTSRWNWSAVRLQLQLNCTTWGERSELFLLRFRDWDIRHVRRVKIYRDRRNLVYIFSPDLFRGEVSKGISERL